jgi:hypothetical protein
MTIYDDEAAYFDWGSWSRSAKSNPYLDRDLCKVTIFPSRYGDDGWSSGCSHAPWLVRATPSPASRPQARQQR